VLRQLKPRILCIDDELIVGEMLRRWLEAKGDLHVECETKGIDAAASLRKFKPDLIIMDINLPGRDGLAIARDLRTEPWIRHRPVLFYSGVSCVEEAALQAGADGPTKFLKKSVPLSVVEATVRDFLVERLGLYHTFQEFERKQTRIQN
jgi:two-component system response regulator MtrA